MATDPYLHLVEVLSMFDNADKYIPFKVINTAYKSFDEGRSHINADIFIPQTILSKQDLSKCPVMVRIHGGFLVTGSSRYPVWFANWTLDYAISTGAIIVAPDYRLLPEVSGKDILEDMDDFWHWVHSSQFAETIKDASDGHVTPDLDRLLVAGESAGGYLTMQLALSYPSEIRAVIAAYPVLDVKSKFYTEAYPKPILGVPNFPNEIIEEHISAMRAAPSPTVITAANPPDRLKLAFSVFQNGRLLEFLGSEDNLFPMNRVENLAAAGNLKLPPTFIFHGKQDSAVPFEGSQRFYDLVREKAPGAIIKLHGEEGDHGFDFAATLETDWLKDGLETISKGWLGSTMVH
ncbi:hypothetical protein N7537_003472 [Penicillium hordei]|uniref:Alpha/beta hydrolase fold-3 domain-containing protein n=1 Tax=Penicillium hordei TaxID=40994 RepID=A0AAD6H5C5_9EURO|nr:uncharacterized protein N7537_003472 [Penicillium hordei]KAJ5606853.1 hypothetical protein N7537_003472 [Penicillium hordei]